MKQSISHQVGNFSMILCGVACFTMIFVFLDNEQSYENTYQRIKVIEGSQLQNWTTGKLVTARKRSNECSIVHPKLNSCNTLPNYYLYPERRDEFQSAVITFWHIQKAGGSSVERCLNGMQPKLDLPPVQRGGISCGQLEDTYSKLSYFQNESFKPVIQGHNTLGICDFFRDIDLGRKCSTFSVFREPYERAVSNYYYVRQIAIKGNANKGFQRALKMSITEWVKIDGSPMWAAFYRIWRMDMTTNGRINCEMISRNIPEQKWPSNDTIVDEIIENLDKYLSFVGLLEDMLTTYQMLEEIYNLPFVNECYGRHFNKGHYENLNATAKHEVEKKAKRMLMEDKEIRKLMTFDVRLYKKAKEIFIAQMKLRGGG
ncbi:hypothetical protein HOLleu_39237 [Holothuria leucospilota]|uniref:Sulfotransferase n=1 Tax=Holothuria leucospilota TaxID=206669 RepID=A0A9Q1BE75_HOLLE|nr:hypothetical protein HOLleu_39237 [Holothuria leucospilota]